MSNTRIFIVLFILSEGVVTFFGARSAWGTPSKAQPGRRTVIGMMAGAALYLYSASRFFAFWNSFRYGRELSECLPPDFSNWSAGITFGQTIAMWMLSLAFMNGNAGFLRKRLVGVIEKFR